MTQHKKGIKSSVSTIQTSNPYKNLYKHTHRANERKRKRVTDAFTIRVDMKMHSDYVP